MDRLKFSAQLIEHEQLRLKPYMDSSGKLTIGVGRNLADRGISESEALILLDNDIEEHWAELLRKVPWVEELDEVRQRVLADMAFNMGVGDAKSGLLSFSTTLRLVQNDEYQAASVNMLRSLWASQVGNRAKRLSKMMATGEDQPL